MRADSLSCWGPVVFVLYRVRRIDLAGLPAVSWLPIPPPSLDSTTCCLAWQPGGELRSPHTTNTAGLTPLVYWPVCVCWSPDCLCDCDVTATPRLSQGQELCRHLLSSRNMNEERMSPLLLISLSESVCSSRPAWQSQSDKFPR